MDEPQPEQPTPSSTSDDPDLDLRYEPVDPNLVAIVRRVNGELRAEIGEIIEIDA